jgi:hypothetical protein
MMGEREIGMKEGKKRNKEKIKRRKEFSHCF